MASLSRQSLWAFMMQLIWGTGYPSCSPLWLSFQEHAHLHVPASTCALCCSPDCPHWLVYHPWIGMISRRRCRIHLLLVLGVFWDHPKILAARRWSVQEHVVSCTPCRWSASSISSQSGCMRHFRSGSQICKNNYSFPSCSFDPWSDVSRTFCPLNVRSGIGRDSCTAVVDDIAWPIHLFRPHRRSFPSKVIAMDTFDAAICVQTGMSTWEGASVSLEPKCPRA